MGEFSNDLSDDLPQSHKLPKPKLERYEIEMWNNHIHQLRDERYQKKIMNQIHIPLESDVMNNTA